MLGLDLGSKRIGVAVSDRSGTLASPLRGPARSGDRRRTTAIRELVEEEEAEAVVVGLPLSLDGTVGRAARVPSPRPTSWLASSACRWRPTTNA